MQATLKVRRYTPEAAAGDGGAREPQYQTYTLDVPEYFTVLDALIKIREELDGTLAVRCSCRAAVCGSCAMRINGQSRLACKTRLITIAPQGQRVTVEPMANMPLLKDLVVDMEPFWAKVRAVEPWLQPTGPRPEREYIVPNEAMLGLNGVMACIMCGACVSACTVLEIDQSFLGPAALAKAFRFVRDPRDGRTRERLGALSQYGGIWDCTHCFECVTACPKGVAPMDRILELRHDAVRHGSTDTNGARHAEAFTELVRHSGWLDENRLPVQSVGMFNIKELVQLMPVGLRMLVHGKMPPVIHRPIPGIENVRRLFARFSHVGHD